MVSLRSFNFLGFCSVSWCLKRLIRESGSARKTQWEFLFSWQEKARDQERSTRRRRSGSRRKHHNVCPLVAIFLAHKSTPKTFPAHKMYGIYLSKNIKFIQNVERQESQAKYAKRSLYHNQSGCIITFFFNLHARLVTGPCIFFSVLFAFLSFFHCF